MPTSQTPALLTLIDEIEHQVEVGRDVADLQQLRAILRRPTRVAVSERTYLLTALTALRDQLDVVRDLRAGVLDSLRQARPEPPERPERDE